jgi:hypothetical protein
MAISTVQDLRTADTTPSPGPSYSPDHLVGETYLGLWSAGVIPPGPMQDPEAAHRAAADLLRAFGVQVAA